MAYIVMARTPPNRRSGGARARRPMRCGLSTESALYPLSLSASPTARPIGMGRAARTRVHTRMPMHTPVHAPLRISVRMSVQMSMHASMHMSVHMAFALLFFLIGSNSTRPFHRCAVRGAMHGHLRVCTCPTHMTMHMSTHVFVHVSIHMPIHMSTHLSIYMSIHTCPHTCIYTIHM